MLTLFLATMRIGDPRLDVKATLLQPRVTYAEFGAWVQKASGVPILVSPAIRDRKATVLVENRSIRETMDRVAEGLFLEWERTADGYTLRLQPNVAAQEAKALADEDRIASAALRYAMDVAIRLSGESDEALDKRVERLEKEIEKLEAADNDATLDRAATLKVEKEMAERIRGDNTFRRIAILLGGLSASERETLLGGRRLYAASPGQTGMRPLPAGGTDDEPTVVSLQVDPEAHSLNTWSRLADSGYGYGSSLAGTSVATFDRQADRSPLAQRLIDWATLDDATVMQTPLRPGNPPASRSSGLRTMADLLVSFHARTGLPVVSDGFRESVSKEGLLQPKNVKAWIEALDADSDTVGMYERASHGWLMLRRAYYWRRLGVEIPEKAVRTLEASAKGLDDYAGFVGALTPLQSKWTPGTDLVMEAATEPLASVGFLRLWNELNGVDRAQAKRADGLTLSTLAPSTRLRVGACLEESLNNLWSSETLAYVLPGGPSLPDDLRLTVRMDAEIPVYRDFERVAGGGLTPKAPPFLGVEAKIGSQMKALAQYDLPFRPKEASQKESKSPVP